MNKIGKKFGRLLVIKILPTDKVGRTLYECLCDCGKTSNVWSSNLRVSGKTMSCGCLKLENSYKLNKTHGESSTRLYKIWVGMKSRCENKNNQAYPNYGERGIKFSPYWEEYTNFRSWAVSNGYKDDLTIERINVNGDYEPLNCCWIVGSKQSRNQRIRKNNKTGITGVCRSKRGYTATCTTPDGKTHNKNFSINKLGEELALFAAIEYRDLQILYLNILGMGYNPQHGK